MVIIFAVMRIILNAIVPSNNDFIILRIAKIITVKATGIIALNDLAIPVGTLSGILITSALNPSKNLINSTEIKAEINAVKCTYWNC